MKNKHSFPYILLILLLTMLLAGCSESYPIRNSQWFELSTARSSMSASTELYQYTYYISLSLPLEVRTEEECLKQPSNIYPCNGKEVHKDAYDRTGNLSESQVQKLKELFTAPNLKYYIGTSIDPDICTGKGWFSITWKDRSARQGTGCWSPEVAQNNPRIKKLIETIESIEDELLPTKHPKK